MRYGTFQRSKKSFKMCVTVVFAVGTVRKILEYLAKMTIMQWFPFVVRIIEPRLSMATKSTSSDGGKPCSGRIRL